MRHGFGVRAGVTCYPGRQLVAPRPPGRDARRNGPRDDAPQARPKTYAACASTAGNSIVTPRGTTSTGQRAPSIWF